MKKNLLSRLNKKGFEEEGTKFNMAMVVGIIFFITALVVAALLLWPKLAPQKSAEASVSFGTYVWDMLMGGK